MGNAALSWLQLIPAKILCGDLPSQPLTPGQEMNDDLWGLTQRCWNAEPSLRPQMNEILDVLKRQPME